MPAFAAISAAGPATNTAPIRIAQNLRGSELRCHSCEWHNPGYAISTRGRGIGIDGVPCIACPQRPIRILRVQTQHSHQMPEALDHSEVGEEQADDHCIQRHPANVVPQQGAGTASLFLLALSLASPTLYRNARLPFLPRELEVAMLRRPHSRADPLLSTELMRGRA